MAPPSPFFGSKVLPDDVLLGELLPIPSGWTEAWACRRPFYVRCVSVWLVWQVFEPGPLRKQGSRCVDVRRISAAGIYAPKCQWRCHTRTCSVHKLVS